MCIRAFLVFVHDVLMAALAWWLAYLLRFNFDIPPNFKAAMLSSLGLVMPVAAASFWGFGLYRGLWRFSSLPDLKRILFAVICLAAMVPSALLLTHMNVEVPRSVLVLSPMITFLFMGASRAVYRSAKDGHILDFGTTVGREPVLVMGAGGCAAQLLRDVAAGQDWRVVGLLDDDVRKKGRQLQGVRVMGTLAELPRFAADLGVSRVVIAMPSASIAERRRAMELAIGAGLTAMTVPNVRDVLSGRVSINQIRKVELDDLLGRDAVTLDKDGLQSMISGKVIMVTGAGGSIGSELCRQIAAFQPGLLVFFEANEFALYQIEQEFGKRFPDVPTLCAIGDVKSGPRVLEIMRRFGPSLVFHAAAYKHVPLMENVNTWEAVRNNVLGTWTVAQSAIDCGVEKFVLISTDKAVNPANVMGASKRLAEMVCQGLHQQGRTCFEIVRFGNVLGSTGSVIPKFREQIASGGPVTVTHPDIIRYFMSIPEAAQLVLQAGAMGRGGEIFVLDMGEPVKIADLARDMIRLSGFTEDEIRMEFTGLRPGEKLFEELLADDEHTRRTPHPKLRIAQARAAEAGLLDELRTWLNQDQPQEDEAVRRSLRRWVPEYAPGVRSALKVVESMRA